MMHAAELEKSLRRIHRVCSARLPKLMAIGVMSLLAALDAVCADSTPQVVA